MSTSGEQLLREEQAKTARVSVDPLIGTTFAGKYEIESLLGSGGMSSVYAAQNKLMKTRVALKLLQSHLAKNQNSVLRFKQEAQAVNQLKHKNIVGFQHFDVTEDDAHIPYIVMDLLKGKSLSDIIEEQGPLPVERVTHIFMQACSALDHAHSRGIIHRDLKPSNLMIVEEDGEQDVVKIVDFGIAKMLPQEGEELLHLTQTGEIFGSPLYMSPEQCMGQRMDERSDIYSMGCILYEALCAVPPFKGGNLFETMSKHISELPTPLSVAVPKLSQAKALDDVLLRALAKDPEHRYQSMKQMMADLDAIAKGRGKSWAASIAQGWRSFQIKSAPGTKRLPPKFVAGMVVTVAIIAAATTWMVQLHSSDPTMSPHDWGTYPGPAKAEATPEDRGTEIQVKQLLAVLRVRRGAIKPERQLELRNRAASWYMSKGLYNDALAEYAEICGPLKPQVDLMSLPNRGDLARRAGDCFYEARNYSDALKWYEYAVECWNITTNYNGTDGIFSMAKLKLADSYERCGKTTAALKLLTGGKNREEALLQYGPSNRALLFSKLGDLHYKLGNYSDAQKAYQDAAKEWQSVQRPEQLAYVQYDQGLTSEQQKQYGEAEQFFSAAASSFDALKKPREQAVALAAASRMQSRQGKFVDAVLQDIKARSIWTSN